MAATNVQGSMIASTDSYVISEALYFYNNSKKKWSKRFVRINGNMLLMYFHSNDSQDCGGIDLINAVTNIYRYIGKKNDDIGGYQFDLEYGTDTGMRKKFLFRTTSEQQQISWVQAVFLISSVTITIVPSIEKENYDTSNQGGSSSSSRSPLIAKSKALIAKLSSFSPLTGLSNSREKSYMGNMNDNSSSCGNNQISDTEKAIITTAQFDVLRNQLNILEKMNASTFSAPLNVNHVPVIPTTSTTTVFNMTSADVLPVLSSSSSSIDDSKVIESVVDANKDILIEKIIKIAAKEISHEKSKAKKNQTYILSIIICVLLFGGYVYSNYNSSLNLYKKNSKINKINIKYNKGTSGKSRGSNAFTELEDATTKQSNIMDEFADIDNLLNDPIINEAIIKLSKRNQMKSGALDVSYDTRAFHELSLKRLIHRVLYKVLMAPFNVLKNIFKLFT